MATDSPFRDPTALSQPFVTGPSRAGTDGSTGSVANSRPATQRTSGKNSQAERRQITIEDRESRLDPNSPSAPMLKKPIPNVFPLHLAPIDQFFLDDDTARYPMTSIIHLDFAGEVQRDAFQDALADALERHALLRSVIRPAKRNIPCWVQANERLPWMDWGSIDKPLELPGDERIDVTQQTGLRLWVRTGDQKSRVTVQVAHVCTDGTGVYRFLGDVMAAYAARISRTSADFANIDPHLLRSRRRKMANHGHHDFSIPAFVIHSLKQVYEIFGRSIGTLQAPDRRMASVEPLEMFPGVHTVRIDKVQHKKLRNVAASYGGTMNDLLMAEMFRTIVRWNNAQGAAKGDPWLRIMMPFDMREQSEYHMPAANMTSYTFVTRRRSACVDMKELMSTVRDETLALKHQRAGTHFVDAIMAAAHAPFILKFLLGRKRCIATTCLSNIGDPSKRFTAKLKREAGRIVAGNLVLEDVSGVPPMRQMMHATLAVFSYLRKLTISVRCDPYLFDAKQSLAFVSMYRDGLLSHIADDIG